MEQDVQNVEVTNTESENVETQTTEKKEVKTFTQEEVNDMIKTRLRNVPSKEELESFKAWKESQKTESEKIAEKEKMYQQTLSEKEELKRENLVLRKGISTEDAEFVVFKVSKMEGDFEDNLKEFLESNPKFTETKKEISKATGVQKSNTTVERESGVNAILRAKHPELF